MWDMVDVAVSYGVVNGIPNGRIKTINPIQHIQLSTKTLLMRKLSRNVFCHPIL